MEATMKTSLVLATALVSVVAASPVLADKTIGLLGGITGGAAALAPEIMKSYDLAVKQINDQGGILAGEKLVGVIADDGCSPQLGADAATKVINVSGAIGVVGPWCSGAMLSAANSVTIPAGIVLINPAGTSPAITSLEDKDTVFRTVASDEYQGQVLAHTLLERGTASVAVSFINNDYGKGLADAFRKEYEAKGGKIAAFAAHDENKPSYRSDLAELAKGGADTLVLFDYGDTSGLTVMREAIENDFFANFVGGDGMKSTTLLEGVGVDNLSTFLVSSPVGTESESLNLFNKAFKAAGGDPNAVFTNTSYDAVFMLALAIEQAGGDPAKMSVSLRAISDGKGEKIQVGEWAKAKELIAAGTDIDYSGASGELDFDAAGDVPGSYALFKVVGNDFERVSQMK